MWDKINLVTTEVKTVENFNIFVLVVYTLNACDVIIRRILIHINLFGKNFVLNV